MTDNITLPRETVSQLTRLFTDMQLSRLPSLWQVSTLLNILTAAPQQQAEPPSEWPLIKNILDEYGLQAISFVAEWKASQQQAEPVAWMDREGDLYKMPEIPEWAPPHTMLYTTPPQRQWVGLTDEQLDDIVVVARRGNLHDLRIAIEAAHGIKD